MIVRYLYTNKKVTLQGIGTFILDPSILLPHGTEKEKDIIMPENAFQFEFDLKAGEDIGLIGYIVQHTGKMFPLASSDLDSYVTLAKQFLNIGKPLVIEGVGTVQKTQQGDYQFIPGNFITPKIDDFPKQIREKRDDTISFESEGKENNNLRNLWMAVGAFAIILVGMGIYYLLSYNKVFETLPPAADIAKLDTLKNPTDTLLNDATNTNSTQKDSVNFKIVLKAYPSLETADKALKKLTTFGHKVILLNVDSTLYEVAMPFTTPLSDTLRAKDSLRGFFGGKPYVKL
jgi:hypothetical protein